MVYKGKEKRQVFFGHFLVPPIWKKINHRHPGHYPPTLTLPGGGHPGHSSTFSWLALNITPCTTIVNLDHNFLFPNETLQLKPQAHFVAPCSAPCQGRLLFDTVINLHFGKGVSVGGGALFRGFAFFPQHNSGLWRREGCDTS